MWDLQNTSAVGYEHPYVGGIYFVHSWPLLRDLQGGWIYKIHPCILPYGPACGCSNLFQTNL